MTPRTPGHAGVGRPYLLISLLAVAQMIATTLFFYPGLMSPDSVQQFNEAVSGRFTTQHPPMMADIWRILLPFGHGPLPMLILIQLLYWASFAVLAVYCFWRSHRRSAVLATISGLFPLLLNFSGTIWKDVMLSAAWGLGCALMLLATEWRERDRGFWLLCCASGLLLLVGASLRHNAALAGIVLAIPFSLVFGRGGIQRIATFICLAACMVAAVPLSSRLLNAQDTRPIREVVAWDLTGISFFSGHDYRPDLPSPRETKFNCYTPRLYDACPPAPVASRREAVARWIAAIEQEPLAYLKHRTLVFSMLIRFGCRECHPYIVPTEYALSHYVVRRAFVAILLALGATPLGRPYLWLTMAAGLAAVLWRRGPTRGRALLSLIPLSGLVSALSFYLSAPTDEFRYVYWLIYSVVLGGAAYLLTMKVRLRDLCVWIVVPSICAVAIDAGIQRLAPTDHIAPSMQTNY